jgi:hypothetical protein
VFHTDSLVAVMLGISAAATAFSAFSYSKAE